MNGISADAQAALREQFPVLSTCVYLGNNSTGAVPKGAERVLNDYWKTLSTWRESAWDGWHDGLDTYIGALSAFIGAPPGSVALDANLSTCWPGSRPVSTTGHPATGW